MIVLGIVLLIIGFLLKVAILWTLGLIVIVVGLALWLLGALGHAVGGRRHYF
jgi:fatty-acid desaturase